VPHSVNLSLLPLSEAELEFLDERLGRGTVDILSRSYGKCQIISTRSRDVWWVRYYNSMGILILNSLEVADVPVVVHAAAEDLRDSAQRLDEILAPYWSDVVH
jgi:hydrogenase-1 operon protein HyaF